MENKTKFFTTRIDPEILKLMTKVSKNRGEPRSNLVRRAILKELASLSYLSGDQNKALGVSMQEDDT